MQSLLTVAIGGAMSPTGGDAIAEDTFEASSAKG